MARRAGFRYSRGWYSWLSVREGKSLENDFKFEHPTQLSSFPSGPSKQVGKDPFSSKYYSE